jgi:hypothetical protein
MLLSPMKRDISVRAVSMSGHSTGRKLVSKATRPPRARNRSKPSASRSRAPWSRIATLIPDRYSVSNPSRNSGVRPLSGANIRRAAEVDRQYEKLRSPRLSVSIM